MKNFMMKIVKIFKENVWLSVVAVVLMFCLGLARWKCSLHIARIYQDKKSINSLAAKDVEVSDIADEVEKTDRSETDKVYVSILEDNAYLCDTQGNQIFGSCKSIFLNQNYYYDGDSVFRYVDMNRLIGYGKIQNTEATILSQGIYSRASRMADGSACVKVGDEFYYIDKDGKRFTYGQYMDAYPFSESQGSYARVQKMDGSWSVINRQEEEVLSGFESIDELPYCTYIGTGVRDGKVVIFTLEQSEDQQPHVIKELEGCIEIDKHLGVDYILVISKEGKQGVMNIHSGESVATTNYEDIQWGYMYVGENNNIEIPWFQCRKADGSFDVYYGNKTDMEENE